MSYVLPASMPSGVTEKLGFGHEGCGRGVEIIVVSGRLIHR